MAWQTGRPGGRRTAFRAVQRNRARTHFQWLREALWATTQDFDKEAQIIACQSMSLANGASVADAVSLARLIKRKPCDSARALVDQQAKILTSWEDEVGARLRADIAGGSVSSSLTNSKPAPSAFGTFLELLPPSKEEGEGAVGWTPPHSRNSNLVSTLNGLRSELRSTNPTPNACHAPISKRTRGEPLPHCWRAPLLRGR